VKLETPFEGQVKNHPVAGIVLAAGMSVRMGRTKQLMELGGKPLLARIVEAALASELEKLVLVLGHEAGKVREALGSLGSRERLQTVVNERYREGMAASLQAGLRAVKDQFPAVMFLLGDQPLLSPAAINLLLHRFRESDLDICVPVCQNRQGNPVCFSRLFYDRLLAIHGDMGARQVIRRHPDHVLYVEIDDPGCFLDIDEAADAEKILPLLKN
jgi:molybdenum cofactor cytidylyltransferase